MCSAVAITLAAPSWKGKQNDETLWDEHWSKPQGTWGRFRGGSMLCMFNPFWQPWHCSHRAILWHYRSSGKPWMSYRHSQKNTAPSPKDHAIHDFPLKHATAFLSPACKCLLHWASPAQGWFFTIPAHSATRISQPEKPKYAEKLFPQGMPSVFDCVTASSMRAQPTAMKIKCTSPW